MGKLCAAKLIYEGHYEWVVRMSCKCPPSNYKSWALQKKEYTLDQAKDFRNERMRELEEAGLRKDMRGRAFYSKTIGRQ